MQGAKAVQISGKDLVCIRQAALKLPSRPTGPQIILANGDCIRGKVNRIVNDRVFFQAAWGGAEMQLPLSALSALWLGPVRDRRLARKLPLQLLDEKRRTDIVQLRNGDTREGTVVRLDDKTLGMDVSGKAAAVPRDKLAIVALNTELARAFRPRSTYGLLRLTDGARITLKTAKADAGTLTAQTLYGSKLQVSLDKVASLDVFQGKAVYLSDLKPTAFTETPFSANLRWHYRNDRSVAGAGLQVAGSSYDKGIGMHSAGRITYDLNGKYTRFEVLVGLDDMTGRAGRAKVQVLVDGKLRKLDWNGVVTHPGGPKVVDLDVTDARKLTLVVEFGPDHLAVQDHVDWVDARLIKSQ